MSGRKYYENESGTKKCALKNPLSSDIYDFMLLQSLLLNTRKNLALCTED